MTSPLQLLSISLRADQPALLWGPPGIGKTAAVEALAADQGAHLVTVIGSTIDPVDVSGLPTPGGWRLVPWAERLVALCAAQRPVWLFLDELSCVPPSVQAALLRVVWSREIGGHSLRGARIVAAANPADTAADGGTLSGAMASRWRHIQWSVDPTAWIAGELGGWGRPLAAGVAAAAASICGYLRCSPAALLAPPADAEGLSRAWPCPRAWSGAIGLLAMGGGPRAAIARPLVATAVGEAPASEWAAWEEARDLPDPEDLLAGRRPMPSRGDQAYACALALAGAALTDRPDRAARVQQAWAVLAKLRPDVALTPAKALRAGAPECVTEEAIALGDRILGIAP